MGGLCSCFGGTDDEEQERGSLVESTSGHEASPNCFHSLIAYNILFQRGHVRPVSSATLGRTSLFSSSSDDSSISDTCGPPLPLAYDDPRCSLSLPQSQTNASMLEGLKNSDYDGDSKKCLSVDQPPKQTLSGLTYLFPQDEDEDVCPTCLEDYTVENPKILLLCSHHFHLSCIYEWMERNDKCPFCGKKLGIKALLSRHARGIFLVLLSNRFRYKRH